MDREDSIFQELLDALEEHPEVHENAGRLASYVARRKYGDLIWSAICISRKLIADRNQQEGLDFAIETQTMPGEKPRSPVVKIVSSEEALAGMSAEQVADILQTASAIGRIFEQAGAVVIY